MLFFKSFFLLLVFFSVVISAKKRAINTKIQKTTVDSVKVYVEEHASRLKKNVNNAPAKKSEKIDCDVTYQTITLK
ncbi:unnamed protein product [Caenorhabditis nigoni]|uniref:Uncharacterized protein n=1 Tax=Caenorhabditis nigoni TaxID=1611254 RepID=A0A2G5S9V2_9PELO|nr:hypothetical protein B9Z55_028848 [Caenorhabditis nigoni]